MRRRCSTIAFADRPVEVEKLQRLFEAARWAPSSFNEQPWSFLLATRNESPQDRERLASCLMGHNREWAHRAIGYFGNLAALSPDLQRRELAPRQRRPFKDFVFFRAWGHPSELVPD